MNDFIYLLVAIFVGLLAGLVFYGGLWWTVQKGLVSKRPGLLFLSSYLLRSAFVVVSFVLIMGGSLLRLLFCFISFVIARIIVKVYIGKYKPELKSKDGRIE